MMVNPNPEQDGGDNPVEVTFKDDLGIITMRRGENRINEKLVEKLHAALDEVLRNQSVKALVTQGEGKFYSNGLDLPWFNFLQETDSDIRDTFSRQKFMMVVIRILTFPLPTIALINGHAFAGGGILALFHDHVIMQNARGWWCLNEVHINIRFYPTLLHIFMLRLPRGQTFHDVVVLGRRYTGDEAVKAGIVHESCPPKEMYQRALTWVKKVTPPGGYNRQHLQTMKEDVYATCRALQFAPAPRFGSKL